MLQTPHLETTIDLGTQLLSMKSTATFQPRLNLNSPPSSYAWAQPGSWLRFGKYRTPLVTRLDLRIHRVFLTWFRMLPFNALPLGPTRILVWSLTHIFLAPESSHSPFFPLLQGIYLTSLHIKFLSSILFLEDSEYHMEYRLCMKLINGIFKLKKQNETSSLKPNSWFNTFPEDRINLNFLTACVVLKFTSDRGFITPLC